MAIVFSNENYDDAKTLKMRLEDFFSRADIESKLGAVARHVVPDGKLHPSYGLSMFGLQVFDGHAEHDGDPYNLCRTVLDAYAGAIKDKSMPTLTRMGLDSVAKQMIAIVDLDANDTKLKTDILRAAKTAGLTGKEKL